MRILITGGAGFVGSNLAVLFRATRGHSVIAFDNLRRNGSELAVRRLAEAGVVFIHGDVRNAADFEDLPAVDLVIDCSAEPSVQAGYSAGIRYLIDTNLGGTAKCLEYARRNDAAFIFLSTSRVYSIPALRALPLEVIADSFALAAGHRGSGWSEAGIGVDFPTDAPRSLYGTTKFASELLVEEYNAAFSLKTVINRCGVVAGPWQMGKVDQGFFVLWVARHLYGGSLRYTGFGGYGHQVRDVLHVGDLFELLCRQMEAIDRHSGCRYNVGGGLQNSVSLSALTALCAKRIGVTLQIGHEAATHPADIPYYVTDNAPVTAATGWSPSRGIEVILDEVAGWLAQHRSLLEPILGSRAPVG